MTRHALNQLTYANDPSLEYRPPRAIPPVARDGSMALSLCRQNPRTDPMTRQTSRSGSGSHGTSTNANSSGTPRRRIQVAVGSILLLLLIYLGYTCPSLRKRGKGTVARVRSIARKKLVFTRKLIGFPLLLGFSILILYYPSTPHNSCSIRKHLANKCFVSISVWAMPQAQDQM